MKQKQSAKSNTAATLPALKAFGPDVVLRREPCRIATSLGRSHPPIRLILRKWTWPKVGEESQGDVLSNERLASFGFPCLLLGLRCRRQCLGDVSRWSPMRIDLKDRAYEVRETAPSILGIPTSEKT